MLDRTNESMTSPHCYRRRGRRSGSGLPLVISILMAGLMVGCSDSPSNLDKGAVEAGPPATGLPDRGPPDQGKIDAPRSDRGLPDLAPPDLPSPDVRPWSDLQPWPDLQQPLDVQPWPDQCVPACTGKLCGAPDGCGGTCKAGSGCYSPPGVWKKIKAGTFKMGSPPLEMCRLLAEAQYQVTLTKSFEIMITEVTQGMFWQVMGSSPSYFAKCGNNCPVEQVSWHTAAKYANKVSTKAGLARCYKCTGSGWFLTCGEAAAYKGKKVYTCPGFRLPTEAEWEYAYRAGTTTAFYSGAITWCSGKNPNLAKIGWYNENSQVTYPGCYSNLVTCRGTHTVGLKAPNAWGLYDMAGNVWEWCHDWYDLYPKTSATNPAGSSSGLTRIYRGGSWYSQAGNHRAAARWSDSRDYEEYDLGFRLVRSLP